MIGICIPAHDEEDLVEACVHSVLTAAAHPDLGGEAVKVVVVLDSCTDGTAALVAKWPVVALSVDAHNGREEEVGETEQRRMLISHLGG